MWSTSQSNGIFLWPPKFDSWSPAEQWLPNFALFDISKGCCNKIINLDFVCIMQYPCNNPNVRQNLLQSTNFMCHLQLWKWLLIYMYFATFHCMDCLGQNIMNIFEPLFLNPLLFKVIAAWCIVGYMHGWSDIISSTQIRDHTIWLNVLRQFGNKCHLLRPKLHFFCKVEVTFES